MDKNCKSKTGRFCAECFVLKIILLLFIGAFLSYEAYALTYVVNSQNWQDTYSVMLYTSINYTGRAVFVTGEKQALVLPNDVGTEDDVFIISSRRSAYIAGYRAIFESKGFRNVQESTYDNINLEMARRINQDNKVTSFIITDPGYSYNAIALAPYASVSSSFVIFATRDNIAEVQRFLASVGPDKIILYGNVQREVRLGLAQYNPEIINENGDKFLNNIQIVKRTLAILPSPQVLLSNGEFIESEIIVSRQPVLFVGKSNVPTVTQEFLKSNPTIKIGILVGNELLPSAQSIRRQTGIAVIIKFGRDSRVPAGGMGAVEALDMFYLPPVNITVIVNKIQYNRATNRLEVTVKNIGAVAAYAKGTYTIRAGNDVLTVGDTDAVFIDSQEIKTFTYALDRRLVEELIPVDIFLLFGEAKSALEYVYEEKAYLAGTVEVNDDSSLIIVDAYYNKKDKAFYVTVENNGKPKVFASSEIVDISINNQLVSLSSEKTIAIESGKRGVLKIPADLAEDDIINNNEYTLRVYYGEREDTLIKVVEQKMQLVVKSGIELTTFLPYIAIVILLILILTSRKKCKNCGKHNSRRSSHCKHCKAPLK